MQALLDETSGHPANPKSTQSLRARKTRGEDKKSLELPRHVLLADSRRNRRWTAGPLPAWLLLGSSWGPHPVSRLWPLGFDGLLRPVGMKLKERSKARRKEELLAPAIFNKIFRTPTSSREPAGRMKA
jgi:hypothetical protein